MTWYHFSRQLSNALGQSGGQDYDPTQSETFRLLQQTEREKQEMGSNNSSHANLVRSYSNQREPSNDHAIQSMSFRRLQKETDYNGIECACNDSKECSMPIKSSSRTKFETSFLRVGERSSDFYRGRDGLLIF